MEGIRTMWKTGGKLNKLRKCWRKDVERWRQGVEVWRGEGKQVR